MMRAMRIVSLVGTLITLLLAVGAAVAFKVGETQSYALVIAGLFVGVVAIGAGFIYRWRQLRDRSEEDRRVHPFL